MRLVKGAFTALPCKSIVLSMFLVALLVGVSGAGVSGTRVHVPTRSASPASLPGGDHPARMLWHRAAGGPGAPPAVRIVVCRSRLCRADPGQLRSTRCLALHRGSAHSAHPRLRCLPRARVPGGSRLDRPGAGGASRPLPRRRDRAERPGPNHRGDGWHAGAVRRRCCLLPPCAYEAGAYSSAEFYAPVLILIGEKDDWTPAADCEQLHARQHAQTPGRVRLTVFPGATHAFDFNVPPRRNEYGKYQAFEPRCRAASGAFPS